MKLKGTSAVGIRTRTTWSLDAKVRAYALVKNEGVKPADAFRQVAEEFDYQLGRSYSEHPHSHVYRFAQSFSKAIEKDDQAVIAALRANGLLEDDEADESESEE